MSAPRAPEELLEEARRLIGVETEPVRSLYPIEHEPIRRFCHAGWDDNPLFTDPEYAQHTRYRGVICPPLAITSVTVFPGGPLDSPFPPPARELTGLPPIPAPGKLSFVLGVEWEFLRPVRVGDHLTESQRYADVWIRPIRLDPKAFAVLTERIYRNQQGEVVAIAKTTMICHRTPEEVRAADGS